MLRLSHVFGHVSNYSACGFMLDAPLQMPWTNLQHFWSVFNHQKRILISKLRREHKMNDCESNFKASGLRGLDINGLLSLAL